MRRLQILILSCLVATSAFAQEQSDQQPQVEEVNIVQPKQAPPFTFGGSLEARPLCHDKQDFCLSLVPAFNVGTKFGLASGRVLSFDLYYTLFWQRFITTDVHDSSDMDFRNWFDFVMFLPITDKLDFSLFSEFELYYQANDKTNDEFYLEVDPEFGYQVTKSTRIALGYIFRYDLYPNLVLGPGEIFDGPSGDADDVGSERIFTASTFPQFDPFGNFLGISNTGSQLQNDLFLYSNGIFTSIGHTFSSQTKGAASYRYGYWESNDAGSNIHENRMTAKLTHSFNKTRIGTTTLGTEYRFRIFDFEFAQSDTGTGKRRYRHRWYAKASHSFTDNFSLEFEYRLEARRSNLTGEDYTHHRTYFGPKVSF